MTTNLDKEVGNNIVRHAGSILLFLFLASLLTSTTSCNEGTGDRMRESVKGKILKAEETLTSPPVGITFSKDLSDRLTAALTDMDRSYSPRTRYINEGGTPVYTNRLILEVSPYLLQHAHNPVNWFPWGEDAFRAAREEGKLIFLSIGYSTCHWCHVMEEESFDDLDVATALNENFISIKVDREERPDIDNIFMTVCQAMTGSGGWPLTIVMTPEKKPVFAGTYFPKTSRLGMPGLMEILPGIVEAWRNKPDEFERVAERIESALLEMENNRVGGEDLSLPAIETAYSQLDNNYDPLRGGFGQAPKFPTPHNLTFLLRMWKRSGDDRALEMVKKTLTEMRLGGIYDHIGYGFHRYSTDPDWLVPHFEKMLYDQALLSIAYIEAFRATGDPDFSRTAHEILTYVLRDMTSPEGGFYSAEDADSEGEEGKFYTWSTKEILKVLDGEEGRFFIETFNAEEDGNFSAELPGLNILHLKKSLRQLAVDTGMNPASLERRIEDGRSKLFRSRKGRIHPIKDDKILTAWNGLMISAFSKGYQTFSEERYLIAAQRAADFILSNMTDDSARLVRRYRQGVASLPAHVNDYAFLVQGLLDLYEASFDVRHLKEAIRLVDLMVDLFWDDDEGALFYTAVDSEKLLIRRKEIYDGAIPSGNSVASLNFLRLWRITARADYGEKAEKILRAFSGQVASHPSAYTQLMSSVDFNLGPSYEVVISGKSGSVDTRSMIRALQSEYIPNKVVIFRPTGKESDITEIADYTANQTDIDGQATAYVCQNFACKRPTTSIPTMLSSLGVNQE
jgi:uncharacterized protein YyaL (SSP411 family)